MATLKKLIPKTITFRIGAHFKTGRLIGQWINPDVKGIKKSLSPPFGRQGLYLQALTQ